jgi:hypothetical protein
MKKLDYSLLTDGASDRSLLPIIGWLLRRTFGQIPLNGYWADLARSGPLHTLPERIHKTIQYYQPELIFVHRDAEAQDPCLRYEEISAAMEKINESNPGVAIPHICVVPVRMTETWLLFDEKAIRKASGNPNGQAYLGLPSVNQLETIGSPKEMLFEILKKASELRGRQRSRFNPAKCRVLVAEYTDDFSPLLGLSAFNRLYEDVKLYARSMTG